MLNVTQDQLRDLLNSMNIGFILLDADFRIVRLNTEALRVDGRAADAIVGRTVWEAWPGRERDKVGRLLHEAMAQRVARTMSHHHVGRRELWLELRFHPFGDGIGIFFRDVTQRQLAEAALQETQERFELAAQATNDIIWDWDIPANDIHWSQTARSFTGTDDTAHHPIDWWQERLHPHDRERVAAGLARALASRATYWSDEYRLRRADGEYAIIYERCFIIRDDNGAAIRAVGALVDLTEKRTAEQKVQQLQSELIHVSRVSAMGTMASTLAHELNQPLTAVTSYLVGCQRLLESGGEDREGLLLEGMKGAHASALRAGDVIRRLRAMTERGEVCTRAVPLGEAVEEAMGLALVGLDESGLDIRLDVPPTLAVEADPIQLQQVMLNLVRNALQAMQNAPCRKLEIAAAERRGFVEILVRDSGAGIAPEIAETLFEPFTSGREEGMGIGLSISRTIVEAHGGRIWAEANPGGGTVFFLRLPAAACAAEIAELG
ncbi:ATP-binding protein [Sphingosinicella sp. LY1275]|uniref:ATP-binding protein n=1 Tax=Sphingosinicella sp. LY1275 TaxID=3095379 RepID=UPI002ADED8D9|nr:ATP-binding protein [Sphingosinicella sp. LY1275]MEA1014856.1 PAS domain-containing protein [Sphingosinicella sp. LY1275]